MSKAIKWQIPFASLSGTLYRLDIYAEGYTGNPIQLTAGETPFVTDEDSSEDFFAPIRTQTGSIQVCTRKPDGTMLTLDEILPANNIDHPVRLINLSNSNAIEWQGFLSCEAYSQNYTAIPENLTLSVISVLEAMDSVEIGTLTGAIRGHKLLYEVLAKIASDCGLTMFTQVVYSRASWSILNKYFDTYLFYEAKDQINGNTVRYVLQGLSCKELLNRLCTFMGWIARERGTSIFLQRIGEGLGMYMQSLSSLNTTNDHWETGRTILGITSYDMSELEWRGTDHKRDILQGAKSVSVLANIEDYDADMDLPDYPGSSPTSTYIKTVDTWNSGTPENRYVENVLEQDDSANNRCEFPGYHYGKCWLSGDVSYSFSYLGTSTKADFLSHAFLRTSGNFKVNAINEGDTTHYAGAAFIRYAAKTTQQGTADTFDKGLYCVFLNGIVGTSQYAALTPIFKLHKPEPISLYSGTLHLQSDMVFLGVTATDTWLDYATMTTNLQDDIKKSFSLYLKLRVGQWWCTGAGWSKTESAFIAIINGSGLDLDIPVKTNIFGEMELSILPGAMSENNVFRNASVVFEAIFKSLEVSFTPKSGLMNLDKKENSYLQILNTSFRDEVSINTDLATDCYNLPSPSLIMDDPTVTNDSRYTTTIPYYRINAAQPQYRRPEVDLLNRLATYYGAARQTLELIVKHPTAAALPLLKLNGISPDTKKYLPLSESRDWREETCTLTCFETI